MIAIRYFEIFIHGSQARNLCNVDGGVGIASPFWIGKCRGNIFQILNELYEEYYYCMYEELNI